MGHAAKGENAFHCSIRDGGESPRLPPTFTHPRGKEGLGLKDSFELMGQHSQAHRPCGCREPFPVGFHRPPTRLSKELTKAERTNFSPPLPAMCRRTSPRSHVSVRAAGTCSKLSFAQLGSGYVNASMPRRVRTHRPTYMLGKWVQGAHMCTHTCRVLSAPDPAPPRICPFL